MSHCTIIGMVVAKPEARDELMAMLTAQVAPTRVEPGCMNYDFHVDAQDSCVFMFYENWRSKADLDAHFTDLDAYQKRMHTANILRAVKDMRAQ